MYTYHAVLNLTRLHLISIFDSRIFNDNQYIDLQWVPTYIEIQIVPSCPVQGSVSTSLSTWNAPLTGFGMKAHNFFNECSSNNVTLPLKSCNHIFYECPSPPPSPPDKC